MGVATVTGGGTNGLYSIAVDVGAEYVAAAVEGIQARLDHLLAEILIAVALVEANIDLENQAQAIQSADVVAFIESLPLGEKNPIYVFDKARLIRSTEVYLLAQAETRISRNKYDFLRYEILMAQKELQSKQAINTEITGLAWCADLTEDAAGTVATVEIPGERTILLVAPGGRAPAAGDGHLLDYKVQTGPQSYFNLAILPGWQKFMPDYRAGTITGINYGANTADVTLWNVLSSAQNLNVNLTPTLSDVPVDYMTCDADAFVLGDEVVVRFGLRSWGLPTVIGFVTNPQACGCSATVGLFEDFSTDAEFPNDLSHLVDPPVPPYVIADSPGNKWIVKGNITTAPRECWPRAFAFGAIYPNFLFCNPAWEFGGIPADIVTEMRFGARLGILSFRALIGTQVFTADFHAYHVIDQDNISALEFGIQLRQIPAHGGTPSYCFMTGNAEQTITFPGEGWHVFKINFTETPVGFYIDDVLVAQTSTGAPFKKFCLQTGYFATNDYDTAGCLNDHKIDYILVQVQ